MIKLKNVHKSFGDLEVLKGINLTVEEGEVVCIIGPSGSGKSTMLRCMNQLETITSGKVFIGFNLISHMEEGEDLLKLSEKEASKLRTNLGMVFQRFNLFPHLTVLQNLTIAPKLVKGAQEKDLVEKAENLLRSVGLYEKKDEYPNKLSGGQQQRVALARALVSEPTLLLLDEPLSNLDAKLREAMRFEIKELQLKLGITVVYVTHDQSEAMAMSDKIIVMNKGVIQQIGTPMNIYETPVNDTVADFIGLVNFIESDVTKGKVRSEKINYESSGSFDFEGKGILAIRPENIEITTGPYDLEGILEARSYLGDSVDYRINVNGEIIRLIDSVENMVNLNKGDTVRLKIHKSMVFPAR